LPCAGRGQAALSSGVARWRKPRRVRQLTVPHGIPPPPPGAAGQRTKPSARSSRALARGPGSTGGLHLPPPRPAWLAGDLIRRTSRAACPSRYPRCDTQAAEGAREPYGTRLGASVSASAAAESRGSSSRRRPLKVGGRAQRARGVISSAHARVRSPVPERQHHVAHAARPWTTSSSTLLTEIPVASVLLRPGPTRRLTRDCRRPPPRPGKCVLKMALRCACLLNASDKSQEKRSPAHSRMYNAR
jgi:hypothetical protein